MAVIDVVKSAATVLGIAIPDQLFTASGRTAAEMRACVNRAAVTIRDEYDWQQLKLKGSVTGDASKEGFDVPSDFGRFLLDGSLYSSSFPGQPLDQILSFDDWIQMTARDFTCAYGTWTLFGDQLHIQPIRASGEVITFGYISNSLVKPSTGDRKAKFTADNDGFVLDDDLLERAIIWNWKKSKNQPYAAELQDYEDALEKLIGSNKGPRILIDGRRRHRSGLGAGTAFPNAVGQGVQDNTPNGYSILVGKD